MQKYLTNRMLTEAFGRSQTTVVLIKKYAIGPLPEAYVKDGGKKAHKAVCLEAFCERARAVLHPTVFTHAVETTLRSLAVTKDEVSA